MNTLHWFLSLDPCFVLQKKANSDTFLVETEASSFQSHSELLAEFVVICINVMLESGQLGLGSSRPESTRPVLYDIVSTF